MLSDVKAAEVIAKIDEGNKMSIINQKSVALKHSLAARTERLSIRQEWAAERKELEALLAVVQRREPKEVA